MTVTLQGVRGSIPSTHPHTKGYGGNTSCVEVVAEGWRLLLDAGSGIQNITDNPEVTANRIDILLTHLHMDHIQGLGFFRPLFNPLAEIHIWGPASKTVSLRTRLGRYFSPPLFPVYFRNLTCRLFLHEVEDSSFSIGPFSIQSCYVTHPGPTVGFRIQHEQKIFTYLPDHEPALGLNGLIKDTRWLSGSDLAREADVLLHDAQYTAKEYAERIGWGHSSMEDTLEFASLTGAKSLLLAHHDPLRTDIELDKLYLALQENTHYPFHYEMAFEGQVLVL